MKTIGLMACAWLIGGPALAQDVTVKILPPQLPKGFEQEHISKASLPGQEIRLWAAQMLAPDCTTEGKMQTEIMEQPKHGQARLSDAPFFGNFVRTNVRYGCNRQKSPGEQVFYTADANFHGRDKVVFQNSTSNGRIRKWVVDIDVK